MKYKLRGFTLIELLVVIAIIGILASIVMASVNVARDKGMYAAAQMELDSLKTAFFQLYSDTGVYPNGTPSYCRIVAGGNEIDLSSANVGIVANGAGWSGWQGPYMPEVTDPWGNPYYLDEDYQCLAATKGCQGVDEPGNDSSVIVSCGPNGALNNGSCAYDADNIVYRLCDAGSG